MAPHSNAILLISSPDRKGLVARISDFIYQHDGNILHADEHMDEEAKRFLMRMEWDLGHIAISLVAGGCSCVLGSAACRLGLFPISPVKKLGRR